MTATMDTHWTGPEPSLRQLMTTKQDSMYSVMNKYGTTNEILLAQLLMDTF